MTARVAGVLLLVCAACEGVSRHPEIIDPSEIAGRPDAGGSAAGNPTRTARSACSPDLPCAAGETCLGGECTRGCATDAVCLADERCDRDALCHRRSLEACVDGSCAATQPCVGGLCVLVLATRDCVPASDGTDGCGADAACALDADLSGYRCLGAPGCPVEGRCPVGSRGAACNDGLLAEKARICLPGRCQSQDDCPAAYLCRFLAPADPLGFCTLPRIVCESGTDCPPERRCVAVPGEGVSECR